MSQGMCLYDAQQRIVFANDRYADIYRLTPEQAKPGTTLREVFAVRAVQGAYGEIETENFIRAGLERFGKCTSEILRLAMGGSSLSCGARCPTAACSARTRTSPSANSSAPRSPGRTSC